MIALLLLLSCAQDDTFAGRWETTFGEMTLRLDGARVTGSYSMSGQTCTIAGEVAGRKLTFIYRESDTEGEGGSSSRRTRNRSKVSGARRGRSRGLVGRQARGGASALLRRRLEHHVREDAHRPGRRSRGGMYSLGEMSTIEGEVKTGRSPSGIARRTPRARAASASRRTGSPSKASGARRGRRSGAHGPGRASSPLPAAAGWSSWRRGGRGAWRSGSTPSAT